MKQEQEPQGTRRQLLIAPALPLLRNLEPPQYQWRSDQEEEQPAFVERPNTHLLGDVIQYGNTHYLIKRTKAYPMSRSEFSEYAYKSRFSESGGRVFANKGLEYLDLPRGRVTRDQFTLEKYGSRYLSSLNRGGVLTMLFVGSFTDGGAIDNPLPLEQLFGAIQEGLASLGWNSSFVMYFTYGQKEVEHFSVADTVRNPQETFQAADGQLEYVEEEFPLARLDLIGHSWGGVVAQYIAAKYPHMVNSLTLIASPVRGEDEKENVWVPFGEVTPFGQINIPIDRGFAASALRASLSPFGIHEEMTSHLFSIRKDEEHQKQLDTFIPQFRGFEKRLTDLVSVDDPLVPVESTLLQGKPNVLNGRQIPSAWKLLLERPRNPLQALSHHWIILEHPVTVRLVNATIGENRAAA